MTIIDRIVKNDLNDISKDEISNEVKMNFLPLLKEYSSKIGVEKAFTLFDHIIDEYNIEIDDKDICHLSNDLFYKNYYDKIWSREYI